MSEFVTIHCGITNGVILRTFKEVEGPFGTISYLPKDQMTLKAGRNHIPARFFREWLAANSDNDLVKNKFIERR